MHHEMGVGYPLMDRLDDIHREHVAGRLVLEFVGAVRRADGNGKRVYLRCSDKVGSLIRVRQKLLLRELAFGAVTVLFLAFAGLQAAQAAELASTETPTQCAISVTLEVMAAL